MWSGWHKNYIVKILLVRLDGIGDALACTPLLAALRDAGHRIGIALTPRNAAIFARDACEWTHVLERTAWPGHGHAPRDVERTVVEAAKIGYELALVASEEPDAYDLAMRCAPKRVGFTNGWEKPLKTFATRRKLDRAIVRTASPARVREHEVQTMFRLGAGLHAEREPSVEAGRLRPLVCELVAAPSGIAVQLSPKWRTLGIDRARLSAIVRELAGIGPVRLLASAQEAAEIRDLGLQGAGIDATIFDGAEGMRAWKRAIVESGVLVTPDTGAAHVAGMTGTPCVDVFPQSANVRADMQRWRPWASPCALLVGDRDAPIVAAARDLLRRTEWQTAARS